MACCNASTLSAERRRRHFSRTSLNTRSTALSQEPLVGVGWSGVFVRRVVIHNKVNLLAEWGALFNQTQHIHRGEQSSRSVALIIVGLGRTMACGARQTRLRAAQRLDLT